MTESERTEFLHWYEQQKDKPFDNKKFLEEYCHDDVSVLREACQRFRQDFIQIANIDVFQEAITIASVCNKVFRKQFLQPNTVGIITSGGYTGNKKFSKKVLMWLVHMEKEDDCRILHARNGREFRSPKLPNISVDGFCAETNTFYEFLGCYFHGHNCRPFRDIATASGETLSERYHKTMSRLEVITQAGYTVKLMWECVFDATILKQNPELLTHPVVEHTALNTRDALNGCRTEALRLHYRIQEGVETIRYLDVCSLYPYICK